MSDYLTPPDANQNVKNVQILKSLKSQGLETIRFEDCRYTLQPIGQGFWGEVFKITTGDSTMVLKTVKRNSDQGIKYSVNEVEIMRLLDHPNIVKFLGVCVTDNDQLFPLIEYINGGTLEDFLQNDSLQIPWITRLSLALDIASGMVYLHSHNIMHRDLTSTNILLRIKNNITEYDNDSDDIQVEALISDFGLAKDVQKERALSVVGSVDWMAPEVIMGKEYGKKADVFSYGIILCEMIGRCEADPDTSVIRTKSFEVDFDEFTKRSCEGCPPGFLNLAKMCCKLDPEERPCFDRVYTVCDDVLVSLHTPCLSFNTRESLEKLNISSSENINTMPPRNTLAQDVLEHEPRFKMHMEDLVILEEDRHSITSGYSLRSSSFRSKTGVGSYEGDLEDRVLRRASIINPIPSVNRYSGRIVLTIRNEGSPQEILRATPDFLAPPIPPLDIKLIDENEGKALDELSVNSTLVFFDPSAKISSKRRTSSGLKLGHHKNHAQPREIPFGRQHFSHKKRITPLLNRMFSKSKSPKGDGEPSKTASLLNFFKNLNRGSSGHNHIKSKVAKRKTSDDKESGIVTKLVSPHSPKHTKYTKTRYPSKSERSPTKSIDDPLSPYVCLCGRPECRDCYFRLRAVIDTDGTPRNHDDMEDSRDRTLTVKHVMTCPGASVNRNDSYRAMKPFRTQSAPMEYEATKSGRSRSFREKIGLFPDKTLRK